MIVKRLLLTLVVQRSDTIHVIQLFAMLDNNCDQKPSSVSNFLLPSDLARQGSRGLYTALNNDISNTKMGKRSALQPKFKMAPIYECCFQNESELKVLQKRTYVCIPEVLNSGVRHKSHFDKTRKLLVEYLIALTTLYFEGKYILVLFE